MLPEAPSSRCTCSRPVFPRRPKPYWSSRLWAGLLGLTLPLLAAPPDPGTSSPTAPPKASEAAASNDASGSFALSPAETDALRRYLNIRTATGPSLAPDGSRVAFLTNITGTSQVWSVPREGGWPDQLTFFEENVSFVRYSPDGKQLAVGVDPGGSENYQLYLVDPDGGNVRPFATMAGVKHNFGAWSPDGQSVVYASNARNKAFFDLYRFDLASGQTSQVLQGDQLNAVADWSEDGKKLLISRENRSFDNDLFILELATGKLKPLSLEKDDVRYLGGQFAPSGDRLYLTTDRKRDFLSPASLTLSNEKLTYLAPDTQDTDFFRVSPDGKWQALGFNQDGVTRLSLSPVENPAQTLPLELPMGVIGSPDFSNDGKYFTFTLNGPRFNSDVWVADLEKGTVQQVTRSGRSGLPQERFVEPTVVRYSSPDGLKIPALFFLPPGAPRNGSLPAVVRIHGGPEMQARQVFNTTIQLLLARGYAVLEPNVRGSTGYGRRYAALDDVRLREGAVADMGAAVTFLKESGYVDPQRIAVMGGSYGGFMVLSALTSQPDLWAAGIDVVGIANFKTFLQNTSSYRRALRISEYGDPVKDGEFLDKISPIHHVDRIKAPLQVIHGANDPRVPQSEADQIVQAVKQKGGVVEYLLFPDEGHGVSKLPNRVKVLWAQMRFLDQHVKNRPATR